MVKGSALGISKPHAAGVRKLKVEKEFLVEANPLNTSGVFVEGLSNPFLVGLMD
jgi:hypothetical protein